MSITIIGNIDITSTSYKQLVSVSGSSKGSSYGTWSKSKKLYWKGFRTGYDGAPEHISRSGKGLVNIAGERLSTHKSRSRAFLVIINLILSI